MNRDLNNRMDDLLVKCMLEEATTEERQEVDAWLLASEENKRYYLHFKLIWKQSSELAVTSSVNENDAWNRFKDRTQKETIVVEMPRHNQWSWLRIAASLFVLMGVGWFAYTNLFKNQSQEMVSIQSKNESLADTLPDGSIITLNRMSSITYPEDFGKGSKRPVTLKGEAFFDVHPDKTKPFVITVNEVTVTVLGTSFNIKSNGRGTEVIVETGLVEVGKSNESIKLKPKEKVIIEEGDGKLTKEKSEDELYKYYRTKKFVCNDLPLSELIERFNEAYQANIVIEAPSAKNLRINTTFDQRPLVSNLQVIAQTFNLKIEQKGDTIKIR